MMQPLSNLPTRHLFGRASLELPQYNLRPRLAVRGGDGLDSRQRHLASTCQAANSNHISLLVAPQTSCPKRSCNFLRFVCADTVHCEWHVALLFLVAQEDQHERRNGSDSELTRLSFCCTPSTFSRCFNMDGEGVSVETTVDSEHKHKEMINPV